ncbi:MAG: hypothetical protein ABJC09_12295 [Terriglobia bacterium]
MSFLDNLENDLKALEGRDEGGVDNGAFRDRERKAARASAQSAEKLRQSPWTQKLMQQVTVAGHARRLKINLVWAGTILRLEARRNRLELRPMPTGIDAVFGRGIDDIETQPVDLASDPKGLIARWMAILDAQLKLDQEQSQSIPEAESE